MSERQGFGTTLLSFFVEFSVVFHLRLVGVAEPAALAFTSASDNLVKELVDTAMSMIKRFQESPVQLSPDDPLMQRWRRTPLLLRAFYMLRSPYVLGNVCGLAVYLGSLTSLVFTAFVLSAISNEITKQLAREKTRNQQRTKSLQNIRAQRCEEIYALELLMWVLTQPDYLILTLDDHREEYTELLDNYGYTEAYEWYLHRCWVEAKHRFVELLKRIVKWLGWPVLKWLHHHLFKK